MYTLAQYPLNVQLRVYLSLRRVMPSVIRLGDQRLCKVVKWRRLHRYNPELDAPCAERTLPYFFVLEIEGHSGVAILTCSTFRNTGSCDIRKLRELKAEVQLSSTLQHRHSIPLTPAHTFILNTKLCEYQRMISESQCSNYECSSSLESEAV
jgi:hypothetical protein